MPPRTPFPARHRSGVSGGPLDKPQRTSENPLCPEFARSSRPGFRYGVVRRFRLEERRTPEREPAAQERMAGRYPTRKQRRPSQFLREPIALPNAPAGSAGRGSPERRGTSVWKSLRFETRAITQDSAGRAAVGPSACLGGVSVRTPPGVRRTRVVLPGGGRGVARRASERFGAARGVRCRRARGLWPAPRPGCGPRPRACGSRARRASWRSAWLSRAPALSAGSSVLGP